MLNVLDIIDEWSELKLHGGSRYIKKKFDLILQDKSMNWENCWERCMKFETFNGKPAVVLQGVRPGDLLVLRVLGPL